MDVAKVRAAAQFILDETNGSSDPQSVPVPEGMVGVYPTGVEGKGKVRFYPPMVPGENVWGYMSRMAHTLAPNGDTYFPREKESTPPSRLIPDLPWQPRSGPDIVDYVTHERDWWPADYRDTQDAALHGSQRWIAK